MEADAPYHVDAPVDVAQITGGQPLVKYSATEAALSDLRARYAGAKFDLATTAGDKAARAARMELVTLRTALEKRRRQFKAPALTFGQLIDSEAKRITAEILALEEPIDEQIKADERRRAEEKAARERAEAERKAALQAGVDGLRAFVQQANAPGMTAERIAKGLSLLRDMDFLAELWQEYHAAVITAHAETVAALEQAHAGAVEREAEASRLAAERAELERQQAEIRQQQERLEVERRAAEAARAEAEAKARMQEEAVRAEQDRLRRIADEAERAQAVASAPPIVDEVKVTGAQPGMLQDDCADLSKALASKPDAMLHAREAAAQIERPAIAVQTEQATLNGGDIAQRLGFALQADFIAKTLGVPWRDTRKAAKLWSDADFARICDALIAHIKGARDQ